MMGLRECRKRPPIKADREFGPVVTTRPAYPAQQQHAAGCDNLKAIKSDQHIAAEAGLHEGSRLLGDQVSYSMRRTVNLGVLG
ncbi:hypothetical protein Rmf_14890 [Roseomonas fluvialis]|uniref:Uncharacterized protein n=1 Tax=Roseomonas fluvialis TaxID=1750527 RepID=A0ABM7Y172_9PROT|nr:hypothetical protein Rmf_14890 [Roseomonas fluvialis]